MLIKNIKTLEEFKKIVDNIEEAETLNGNYKFMTEKKWITGGIGGGSCWDEGGEEDDPHYELNGTDEPEDNTIEIIFKNMMPEIHYKAFVENVEDWRIWETDFDSEGEYYGNSTDYTIKKLNFEYLFERMKKLIK